MSVTVEFVILAGLLLVALAAGLWIPIALGGAALLFPVLVGDPFNLQLLGTIAWNNVNSFTLTAIPLFVLMGELILNAGFSERLYDALSGWVRRVPGGLLHSNIVAAGIFAAVTGSSAATAGAVGAAAIPEMRARHYAPRLIYGSIASGGMLGILIPPSIIMIIYGSLAQRSVADLFLAGVVPGIALVCCFMIYIAVRVKLHPEEAPPLALERDGRSHLRLVGDTLVAVGPVALLMLLVLGGIYGGYATPTEAGAVGAGGALLLGLAYRSLTARKLVKAVRATVNLTCMILFIVVGAAIYSAVIDASGMSRELVQNVTAANLSQYELLAIIAVIFLILGCFIDGVSIIFLTLPLLLPVVEQAGIDLIWFGVIVVLLVEVGQITPPMGINFFVVQAIDREAALGEIVRGSLPFALVTLAFAVVLVAVPQLALWPL